MDVGATSTTSAVERVITYKRRGRGGARGGLLTLREASAFSAGQFWILPEASRLVSGSVPSRGVQRAARPAIFHEHGACNMDHCTLRDRLPPREKSPSVRARVRAASSSTPSERAHTPLPLEHGPVRTISDADTSINRESRARDSVAYSFPPWSPTTHSSLTIQHKT